jgi:aldehyde:ferredoxin oxidoreductase
MGGSLDIETLRSRHRVLARQPYAPVKLERGYAGRYLRVDLGRNEITEHPVSEEMKELFVGGKGFDLRLMWDEVTPQTQWDSPENVLCISSGPLGGTSTYSGSGKSIVTTISPLTGIPVDSNVGGYFGPLLKFSGWDALVITGKAEEEVLVVIEGTVPEVRIETAPDEPVNSHLLAEVLTEMYASRPRDRVNVSVVSAGVAAEHCLIGCLNFSWYDWRRAGVRMKQAGRGGTGTVFRNKRLKALVVHSPPWKPKWRIHMPAGGK